MSSKAFGEEVVLMSFCCGASMIGTKGTVKHDRTHIHNVPLLFCPVCHHIEVHYWIEKEYEILLEYAEADEAGEVDFEEFVELTDAAEMYQNCVNHDQEEPLRVVRDQIDMALDLLAVARGMDDGEWREQLVKRLKVLSQRREKLLRKRASKTY